jgi:hypothetical protein
MNIVASAYQRGFVFAVHPTTRGFAWALFESPQSPVAWAIVHAHPGRQQHLLNRFARLLDYYEPAVFVLEVFEGNGAKRSQRIQELCRAMGREAKGRGIETPIFDREAVQMAFAQSGAYTRDEIARVIAERVDDFSHRLPRKRKLGDSEDPRQSLFDAAALALTYFTYRGDLE